MNKQLRKMMARKMSERAHGSFQFHNPNNTKDQARRVFEARMNKKKIPHEKVNPSVFYKRTNPYYRMSQEEYEKKFL